MGNQIKDSFKNIFKTTQKTSTKYEDVTKASRGKESVRNVKTDATKKEVNKTLEKAGFEKKSVGNVNRPNIPKTIKSIL